MDRKGLLRNKELRILEKGLKTEPLLKNLTLDFAL